MSSAVMTSTAVTGGEESLLPPGKVLHCSTEEEYYTAIDNAGDKLVVVDCFAEWCPPCRRIAPVLDALARQHPDSVLFIKVDVDKLPTIKASLGVWAMPTFYFFKHGNKVGSFMGADVAQLKRGIANDGKVGMCSSLTSSCSIQ